jgi:MotA/TolQ/ExbB proton channel family
MNRRCHSKSRGSFMRAFFQPARRPSNVAAGFAFLLLLVTHQKAAAAEGAMPDAVAQPPSFFHHLLMSNGIIFGPLMLLLALSLVGLIGYLALGLRTTARLESAAWGPQERALRWLGGIGLLSPLVGLLGTVLGAMLLFMAISRADAVASERMLYTGLSHGLSVLLEGLFLACIALPAYILFKNRLQRLRLATDRTGEAF